MSDAWKLQLGDVLGKRYELKVGTEKVAVMYRFAKSEFKATRVSILSMETANPRIELELDLRIPKTETREEAERMLKVFEERTATPRGFERSADETKVMVSQTGKEAGWVRSLIYAADTPDALIAGKHIRALVENLDIPIVLGIHDEDDLYAKDARPLAARPARPANLPLEVWRFRLENSLLHDLSLLVDPNVRTLKVTKRSVFSTKQLGETVKLAHIGRFELRNGEQGLTLFAYSRDENETALVVHQRGSEFAGAAQRMAQKVRIPISVC